MIDLVEKWQGIEDPDFTASENSVNPLPAPFTVYSFGSIIRRTLPPRINIWADGIFAMGQLHAIVGQGGVGKSRVAMQLAVAQVVGQPFAGLPTSGGNLKWLFIGTENSIYRQQHDLQKMSVGLDAPLIEQLSSSLFFQVVETPDDAFISLGTDDTCRKWSDTLAQVRPDILVADPFGEIMAGDINADHDVRATLRELLRLCRQVNPNMAVILLHHARTGRGNIAQAAGFDKANFALGSKALYSGCRTVVNLAPADPDDHGRIVLSCAKSNDTRPFATTGLFLDETTMLYAVDPDFDEQSWRDDLDGKRTGAKVCIRDVIDVVRHGADTSGQIVRCLQDAHCCSDTTAKKRLRQALEKGYLAQAGRGKNYKVTPLGQQASHAERIDG